MATAQDIINEIRVALHDTDAINYRWSDEELLRLINAAQRQIVFMEPRASVAEAAVGASGDPRRTLPERGVKFLRAWNSKFTTDPDPPSQLLLDQFPGAKFAYSVRKLRDGYSGPCLNVTRVSDSQNMDIGFDADGLLDTAAIVSFCGASSGTVEIWYDQTGNANHAMAAEINQPRIYDGSAVDTQGGLPALLRRNLVRLSTGVLIQGEKTFFIVANTNYTGRAQSRLITSYEGSGAVGDELIFDYADVFSSLRFADGGAQINGGATYDRGWHVHYACRKASLLELGWDGANTASGGSPSGDHTNAMFLYEETIDGSDEHPLSMQEVVAYPSDQSGNRAGIDANINDYFGVY